MVQFKPNQLIVVTIWAENIPEILHFYRDVIGLELLPHHGEQPVFVVGDGVHLLIRRGSLVPAQNAESFPLIAFEVENLDKAIEHLESHGKPIDTEIITTPSAKYILFHDPAGNLLEFAQLKPGVH